MGHAAQRYAGTSYSRRGRKKLSTTVSAETHTYLSNLVRARRVRNMAEAVDVAVAGMRRAENRARLERDTAAYFEGLSPEALREEQSLGGALSRMASEIDFDAE